MRSISIRVRIILLIALIIVFALGIGLSFYSRLMALREFAINEVEGVMLDGQKDRLKLAVHSMALTLAEGLKNIPDKDAQAEYIRRMTHDIYFESDKSGYYFAYKGTECVSLPPIPERQGKDVGNLVDKNGSHYVTELEAKAQKGGGFVNYMFPKAGQGDQPKLGFAEMIPGTDIWIGTGIYIGSIDDKKASITSAIGKMVNNSVILIGGIVLAMFVLVVLPMSLLIFKSIVGPLVQATEAAQKVADGDLRVALEVRGADEISLLETALNTMVTSLRQNMDQIKATSLEAQEKAESAERSAQEAERAKGEMQVKANDLLLAAERLSSVVYAVSSASDQLSAQIEQSSRGSELQARRISETATAMDAMNASVMGVSQNASSVAETSAEARKKANEGSAAVHQVISDMEQININASQSLKDMGSLDKQAEGIGKILNVISDIADQTNLLALNAAIEAARAGDAGRGFAVVADEVRKLAEKTMTATKEVGDAIGGIQVGTHKNYDNVAQAVTAIKEATALAEKSGQTLGEIVVLVDATADQARSIATASEQQSATSEQVTRSIDEVRTISSENADAMGQSAQAVELLAEQTRVLATLIENLQSEGGTGQGPKAAALRGHGAMKALS